MEHRYNITVKYPMHQEVIENVNTSVKNKFIDWLQNCIISQPFFYITDSGNTVYIFKTGICSVCVMCINVLENAR
jgi:hypothetical protein